MKPAFRKTMRQMLDARVLKFDDFGKSTVPAHGWLKAIRLALAIPSRYTARKLGITARAFRQLELNEARGAISLNTLKRAADAMDCDVVYTLVPRLGSFEEILKHQAHRTAEALVGPVAHSMSMEGQSTGTTPEAVEELATEFTAMPTAALWR